MSSTSGYIGAKCLQEFGPIFFDMPLASGYMCAKDFQEFGPRFLACHVPNVACHGVSISIVSISSVSCRVRILRVSVSVPCRGDPVMPSEPRQWMLFGQLVIAHLSLVLVPYKFE